MQIAKARGAAVVVAVCGVANEAFVRRLGADEVVPYDAVTGDTILGDGDGNVPGDQNDRLIDRLREIVRARGRPFDLAWMRFRATTPPTRRTDTSAASGRLRAETPRGRTRRGRA